MPSLESLKQSILTECEEDHVGLWSVISDVEDYLSDQDETTVREYTLNLLHDLLLANEIEAGFPGPDGREFRPLRLSAENVLERIRKEWSVGRRPTVGEVIWFARAQKPKTDGASTP
ncbi:MAG TPA: hypothetical protein VKT80_01100 [Chloroflexota bacterium]|nr:hypothetical protein [Chloroflexota bacterium]